jgi:hypothetical protein
MARGNTSAFITNLENGLTRVSNSVRSKASQMDIMMIVHTQIHPNLTTIAILTIKNNVIQYYYHMLEDKAEGNDVTPSMNPEERPNLEDYKSKNKGSSSTSNTAKTTDFDSVTTVPTPEGDVQVETELEIPLEDDKENIKSQTKSPRVKTLSEEEPSITTVSKEELSERSAEVQQNRATDS